MTQTPKEKAEELIDKFRTEILSFLGDRIKDQNAKRCAFVAVDEIINSTPSEPNFADWDDCGGEHRYYHDAQKTHALHFWQEVKKEIEKL